MPNVGKSTLFNALTKKQVDISNYAFTTIDPNVGVVGVPDERLDKLAKMSNSEKITPTAIEFIDIAGLIKGAAEGEGLGNKFLANIREVDAIAHVVRVFPAGGGSAHGGEIQHVHKNIDPVNDIEIINLELIMADLQTIERRLRETKGNDPAKTFEKEVLNKLKENLEKEILAINILFTEKEQEIVRGLHLLTNKKVIYAFNVAEQQLKDNWQPNKELLDVIKNNEFVVVSNTFEQLLSESDPEEKKVYLEELGLKYSGLDQLIKKGYKALGLITFLTTGPKETRAWTAHEGDSIPRASSAIHTDFEEKFIKADVINWQTLLDVAVHSADSGSSSQAGSGQAWSKAKELGKMRTVGKDYIIQEGDVVEIKI